MAGSNVPQFGNWDNDDNVPYTVYFEKARKNRGGKMINPNDPQENPEVFASKAPSAATSKPRIQSEEAIGYGANSPARNDNTDRRRRASDSAARPARQSAGSDLSFEKSPLHPGKGPTGKGSASPARDGKYSHNSSHGTPGRSYNNSSHGTPGRSYNNNRLGQKAESPDRGVAVPKFGEWDEKNPQSADNYTYIFNTMRNERHSDSTNPSGTPSRPPITKNQTDEKTQKRCCPWW